MTAPVFTLAAANILGSMASAKQRKQQAQAQALQKKGDIIQQTGQQQNIGIKNLIEILRESMLRK